MAAMLATEKGMVRAVAAFNPALDMTGMAEAAEQQGNINNSLVAFLGKKVSEDRALYASASPFDRISKNTAPMLILHGDADSTVPYSFTLKFVEKLKATSVPMELFTAGGASHGFFNSSPWFEKTYARMEEYFKRTLQ